MNYQLSNKLMLGNRPPISLRGKKRTRKISFKSKKLKNIFFVVDIVGIPEVTYVLVGGINYLSSKEIILELLNVLNI